MKKSSTLVKKLHSFADKISGVSHVDNTINPASAYSNVMRATVAKGRPMFKAGQVDYTKPDNGLRAMAKKTK